MIFRSPFPPVTIPDVSYTSFVLQHAERLAEKPALIDGLTGQQYTYGQLADAVRRVASSLAARGFGKGDVLALYSPNLPGYPIPFLAAALLGGITTTINPLYTVEELTFQSPFPFFPHARLSAHASAEWFHRQWTLIVVLVLLPVSPLCSHTCPLLRERLQSSA